MNITRSDEGVDKGISEMGVRLGPREGLDKGRTRDRMGGIGLGGSDWRGWTGGVGLEGSEWGGRIGGVGLEGSD